MNKAQKLIQFFKDYQLDPEDFCTITKAPKLGDFHFEDGTYNASPFGNRNSRVDGIYVAKGYSLTRYQDEREVLLGTAQEFCQETNTVIPPSDVHTLMSKNRKRLNKSIEEVGWPKIHGNIFGINYWWDGALTVSETEPIDIPGNEPIYIAGSCTVFTRRVRGFLYTGNHQFDPTEQEVAPLLANPWGTLQKTASKLLGENEYYLTKQRHYFPTAGCFRLQDGTFLKHSMAVGKQVVSGIYLNCNTYLSLETEIAAVDKDAIRYLPTPPDKEELKILERVIPQVDYALSSIGRDDFRLFSYQQVCERCWNQERFWDFDNKLCPGEKYRLLYLGYDKDVKPEYAILAELEKILLDE